MIISKTPYRISFFGGGTDYPEWLRENKGAVLSTTIDKYIYLTLNMKASLFHKRYVISYKKLERRKKISEIIHPPVRECFKYFKIPSGCELTYSGDLPSRSGVGSSSSFTVGLLKCLYTLKNIKITKKELAKKAIYIERNVLKENVGLQDQIACSYGGLNLIKFNNNDFKVSKLNIEKNILDSLNDNLILCYSGIQRISNDISKKYIKKLSTSSYQDLMNTNYDLVKEGTSLLNKKNIDDFGKLLDVSWKMKKKLHNEVSSRKLNEFYDNALTAGALGGKLLGAGGGGFFLFYVPKKSMTKFIKLNKKLYISKFKFENNGSIIINNSI